MLTTSDILLNYYLDLIFEGNIEELLELGYNSYKNNKEILSSQIPLKLYKNYLINNEEMFKTKPTLLYKKILSLNKKHRDNSGLSNENLDKNIKIIINYISKYYIKKKILLMIYIKIIKNILSYIFDQQLILSFIFKIIN